MQPSFRAVALVYTPFMLVIAYSVVCVRGMTEVCGPHGTAIVPDAISIGVVAAVLLEAPPVTFWRLRPVGPLRRIAVGIATVTAAMSFALFVSFLGLTLESTLDAALRSVGLALWFAAPFALLPALLLEFVLRVQAWLPRR